MLTLLNFQELAIICEGIILFHFICEDRACKEKNTGVNRFVVMNALCAYNK